MMAYLQWLYTFPILANVQCSWVDGEHLSLIYHKMPLCYHLFGSSSQSETCSSSTNMMNIYSATMFAWHPTNHPTYKYK